MKIFSKEKFEKEWKEKKMVGVPPTWVFVCDGKEVIDGYCNCSWNYIPIHDRWTVEQ